ncbi:hypothetical protein ACQJBY_004982 [Aegilops geniculata]
MGPIGLHKLLLWQRYLCLPQYQAVALPPSLCPGLGSDEATRSPRVGGVFACSVPMASSSSLEQEAKLVDPQVQKNAPSESAEKSAESKGLKKKNKKKISRQVAECDVKRVLSFKPDSMDMEVPEIAFRKDPMLAASLYDMLADIALFDDCVNQEMLDLQKDYRQQLKAKGVVTYEVEVDEDYDQDKDYVPLHPGGGRGRQRPGVMKNHQGQTRKLN